MAALSVVLKLSQTRSNLVSPCNKSPSSTLSFDARETLEGSAWTEGNPFCLCRVRQAPGSTAGGANRFAPRTKSRRSSSSAQHAGTSYEVYPDLTAYACLCKSRKGGRADSAHHCAPGCVCRELSAEAGIGASLGGERATATLGGESAPATLVAAGGTADFSVLLAMFRGLVWRLPFSRSTSPKQEFYQRLGRKA